MFKDYSRVTFPTATFPDDPYQNIRVSLNPHMLAEYLPALNTALPAATKGLRLLITAMAHIEGFRPGSRSYDNHNPGNIGNTDNGVNRKPVTLVDGILLQEAYIKGVAAGKNHNYPIGHKIHIIPFKIPGAASMGLPPWAPGYDFDYTGALNEFVKIYSVGARCTNNYIDTIVSYFAVNGLTITPESKLQDIIAMN